MKVGKIKRVTASDKRIVNDAYVGTGYVQGGNAALPDIDTDYQGDRRADVKAYLEQRYNINGQTRVYSAGTFTTLKIKAALKDIGRLHKVPYALRNYITGCIDDPEAGFTDIFKMAFNNKKLRDFITKFPNVIEDLRTILGQPKATSVHASAVIVTPAYKDGEKVDCYDYTPLREMDGLLVSEFDGYDLDEMGYLKTDVLNTKELTQIHQMFDLIEAQYGIKLTLESIERDCLEDRKAFEILSKGYTINIFQFSSYGMTKLMRELEPDNIEDLVALNALYRPATIALGSPETYIRCKHGEIDPVYPWGTYEILKNTYGNLTYQEQMGYIAREIGGFSKSESVSLIKLISKKKVDKILQMKEKFMKGAKERGCPLEEAEEIWHMFEVAGTYSFNRSHAVCYALLAFVGAYIKAHYPMVFYTVALENEKEDDDIKTIMSEMTHASNCRIVSPDINVSGMKFQTNFDTEEIFWSLLQIKFVGANAVELIMEDREARGEYKDVEDFILRMKEKVEMKKAFASSTGSKFTNPINVRTLRNLIYAGCFDKLENVECLADRRKIFDKASQYYSDIHDDKMIPPSEITKDYVWARAQIAISTLGSIDYRRIYNDSVIKDVVGRVTYMSLQTAKDSDSENSKAVICATIADAQEMGYNDKTSGERKVFGKVVLQQDNETMELLCWDNCWNDFKDTFQQNIGKIVVVTCHVKYNVRNDANNLQANPKSIIKIISK